MDQALKCRVLECLRKLTLMARQSVPFGAQKTDPVLREAEELCDFVQKVPITPAEKDVVTFGR